MTRIVNAADKNAGFRSARTVFVMRAVALLVGVVLSLQVAVIAGVWGPIVGIGGIGGALIGLIEGRLAGPYPGQAALDRLTADR